MTLDLLHETRALGFGRFSDEFLTNGGWDTERAMAGGGRIHRPELRLRLGGHSVKILNDDSLHNPLRHLDVEERMGARHQIQGFPQSDIIDSSRLPLGRIPKRPGYETAQVLRRCKTGETWPIQPMREARTQILG